MARLGAGVTMSLGLFISGLGTALLGTMDIDTGYPMIAVAIVVMASGVALTFPAATESIVTALPANKAGVASAMNDTTREVGGAIGIALLGTLLSSGYRDGLAGATDGLPEAAADAAQDNVGAALAIAADVPGGEALAAAARSAFVDGMRLSLLVGTVLLLVASVIVRRLFPR